VERGVGSGWRRGGRAEGIYVFEDQGWYGLVVVDGGYLLVYFLWVCETDVFFFPEKLYSALVPDGC
jgi:hypothetical protein